MSLTSTAKQKFWDKKILVWENARYGRRPNSVSERLKQATRLLAPHIAGKRIIDLGCGSGWLAQNLSAHKPASYLGLDISGTAITAAQARFRDRQDQFQFQVLDLTQSRAVFEADVVVSLGLLDWLTDEEVREVLSRFEAPRFLHSYSSDRLTVTSAMHRLMVFAQYGHRTKSYVPHYRGRARVRALLPAAQAAESSFFSTPNLSFCELVQHKDFAD